MAFIGIPVIAASTLDGFNFREVAAIALVLLCGLVIATRPDKLQDELDQLENRLRHNKHEGVARRLAAACHNVLNTRPGRVFHRRQSGINR